MAKATIKMPDDFMLTVSSLAERTDEIMPRVLEAGAEVVYVRVRGNLQAAIGKTKYKSRSTGQLAAALGVSPAKLDKNGNHNVKIGFSEPRRGSKASNAKLAAILEYGKHGQPPKPFMKPAKTATKAACIAAMAAKLEQEAGQI